MSTPQFTAELSLFAAQAHYSGITGLLPGDGQAGVIHPAMIRWGRVSMCSGDADCNGMFETACSADGYAQCWVRGPGDGSVFCMCT